MTFGWGRRVCSGQGLAEQGTFITIARLLWGFKIEKALDEQGNEVPVDIFDFTYVFFSLSDLSDRVGSLLRLLRLSSSNGLNMRPNPFECRITPRSPEIRAAIEREGRQALDDLAQYDGETKYRMSTYYASEKL